MPFQKKLANNQINPTNGEIIQNSNSNEEYVEVVADNSDTWESFIQKIWNVIDKTKVNNKSYLELKILDSGDMQYHETRNYYIYGKRAHNESSEISNIRLSTVMTGTTTYDIYVMVMSSNTCYARRFYLSSSSTIQAVDISENNINTRYSARFYY